MTIKHSGSQFGIAPSLARFAVSVARSQTARMFEASLKLKPAPAPSLDR